MQFTKDELGEKELRPFSRAGSLLLFVDLHASQPEVWPTWWMRIERNWSSVHCSVVFLSCAFETFPNTSLHKTGPMCTHCRAWFIQENNSRLCSLSLVLCQDTISNKHKPHLLGAGQFLFWWTTMQGAMVSHSDRTSSHVESLCWSWATSQTQNMGNKRTFPFGVTHNKALLFMKLMQERVSCVSCFSVPCEGYE